MLTAKVTLIQHLPLISPDGRRLGTVFLETETRKVIDIHIDAVDSYLNGKWSLDQVHIGI